MRKFRSTLLAVLAVGFLTIAPALAEWNSPTTIPDGTRVIVSSSAPTLILDYRANSDRVIFYATSTCTTPLLSLGAISTSVSTNTAAGSSSKLPVRGDIIYWGPYSGKLYGQSPTGCSVTVDVFRMK